MSKLDNKLIGFIGGGKMVEAIANGIISSGLVKPENIYITDVFDERLEYLKGKYSVNVLNCNNGGKNAGNREIIKKCDVIILGTSPQHSRDMLNDVGNDFKYGKNIVLSIMGGVTLEFLEGFIKEAAVVRIMPNTPMLVNKGVAGIALGKNASGVEGETALEIFNSVGVGYLMPESMIDPLTSVSGCGPAYACVFIQALADGGVQMGLPRDMAIELAAHTLIGTGTMVLKSNIHPEMLKDNVCTPGGATIAGVRALEEGAFRGVVMNAVEDGLRRMEEVAKEA